MTSQDWMRGHRVEAWRHEEKKQSRQQHSLGVGGLKAAASVGSGDRECGCWRESWCNVWAWDTAGLQTWSQQGADELGR